MSDHSENQMHGKSFENMIKGANGIFSFAAADRKRSPNERFDIAAADDHAFGYPTSIKSTGTDTISLSDARQFWQSFDYVPYRILVGLYKQDGRTKAFYAIHEIILLERYRSDLLGEITAEEISEFHEGLKRFGLGEHKEAREWARQCKQKLLPKAGPIILNPKIDSKKQRRLQCSVSLQKLRAVMDDHDQKLHTGEFGNLLLPIRIVSGTRQFRRRQL